MPVIGFLDFRSPDAFVDRLRGFRQGLKDTGYIEGENVAVEYRWAENRTRSATGVGGRLGTPEGCRDRRDRGVRCGLFCKSGKQHDPHRLHRFR